jgi:hypothetical protein
MDLETLRRVIENEIQNYQYHAVNALGTPWTTDRVDAELDTMKTALVAPYWADIELRDTREQIAAKPALSRKCAVVADDLHGTVLVFDPTENEFMLAVRHKDELLSIGVRGDAVGCFMSR